MTKTTVAFFIVALLAGCGGSTQNTSQPSEIAVDTDTGAAAAKPTAKIDDLQFFIKKDPSFNLAAYKSYAWVAMEGAVRDPEGRWSLPDLNIAKEISFLIDRELRAKGMTEAARNPEVFVAFSAVVDMEAQKMLKDKDGNMNISDIPQNALFVALVDPTSEELVWLGAAAGEMQENATNETVKARLDYAITRIIGNLDK